MTITLNSTNAPASSTSTSITFNKPSVSTGDVLLLVVGATSTVTPPTGWTQRGVSTSTVWPRAWTRTIDGTEASTFVLTFATNVFVIARLLAFSGVDGVVPVDVTSFNQSFSTATSSNPGVTPRLDNEFIVLSSYHDTSGGGAPSLVSGSGSAVMSVGSLNAGLAIRSITQTTAAATGGLSVTWDRSGGVSASNVFAMRPTGQNLPPAVTLPASSILVYGDTYTATAVGTDVEGPVTYAWSIVSAPSGNTATITGSTSAAISIKPNKTGTYVFQCVVTDTNSTTATAQVTVVVRAQMWTRVASTAKPGQRRIRKNGSAV